MHIRDKAKLVVRNFRFHCWKKLTGSNFGKYYANSFKGRVQHRQLHKSLGERLKDDDFGENGRREFQQIVQYGLQSNNVCIDYGCGTLRVGVHIIDYLNFGKYWGLDLDPYLLDEGRRLVGEKLFTEKSPNLRVISSEVVNEVAALQPDFLFSFRVLTHVHPDELADYIGNIVKIIGTSAKGRVAGKWSPEETFQYSWQGWAHSIHTVRNLVGRYDGQLSVDREKDRLCPVTGRVLKAGVFTITSRGVTQRP